jgi:hypothetical protein
MSEYFEEYRKNNKEKIDNRTKKYYQDNKADIKVIRDLNKEKHKKYTKQHYQDNKEPYKENTKWSELTKNIYIQVFDGKNKLISEWKRGKFHDKE